MRPMRKAAPRNGWWGWTALILTFISILTLAGTHIIASSVLKWSMSRTVADRVKKAEATARTQINKERSDTERRQELDRIALEYDNASRETETVAGQRIMLGRVHHLLGIASGITAFAVAWIGMQQKEGNRTLCMFAGMGSAALLYLHSGKVWAAVIMVVYLLYGLYRVQERRRKAGSVKRT